MPVLAVIPARLGSTRLPNKPLQLLGGEPLVVRVAKHVQGMGLFRGIVVATDSDEVATAVRSSGFDVAMTAGSLASGTDRVAEAARTVHPECHVVVNIQGDEPFLPQEAVVGAIEQVLKGADIGTASAPLPAGEAAEPSRVKVVTDEGGRALYFSRAPIPFQRNPEGDRNGTHRVHVGVYAFRREVLDRWRDLPASALEQVEGLEQLRALEHGLTIGVYPLTTPAPRGVDTPADLEWANSYWTRRGERE